MEISEFMQLHRGDPGPLTAEQALARHQQMAGRDDGGAVLPLAEQAEDNAVRMLTTGYQPGTMQQLGLQAADTAAARDAELAKIEAARRRADQVMRMHARGDIRAADVPGLLPDDPGSEERVRFLERRLEGLRRQMGAAAAVASRSRQENEDPVEAATRRAHQAFKEATRAMMYGAAPGQPPRPGPRPFAGRGAAVGPDVCPDCSAAGATAAEHVKLCGYAEAAR